MIALSYQEQISKWADVDYYDTNVLRVQLPYIAPTAAPGLTLEQQKERKRELARRLMEINARKREERVSTFIDDHLYVTVTDIATEILKFNFVLYL